jgi:hypothetical protein
MERRAEGGGMARKAEVGGMETKIKSFVKKTEIGGMESTGRKCCCECRRFEREEPLRRPHHGGRSWRPNYKEFTDDQIEFDIVMLGGGGGGVEGGGTCFGRIELGSGRRNLPCSLILIIINIAREINVGRERNWYRSPN